MGLNLHSGMTSDLLRNLDKMYCFCNTATEPLCAASQAEVYLSPVKEAWVVHFVRIQHCQNGFNISKEMHQNALADEPNGRCNLTQFFKHLVESAESPFLFENGWLVTPWKTQAELMKSAGHVQLRFNCSECTQITEGFLALDRTRTQLDTTTWETNWQRRSDETDLEKQCTTDTQPWAESEDRNKNQWKANTLIPLKSRRLVLSRYLSRIQDNKGMQYGLRLFSQVTLQMCRIVTKEHSHSFLWSKMLQRTRQK